MSESAERTPAPPGPVAPAGQPGNAHVQGTRLQRRPTGAPPPLPHPISVNTTALVLVAEQRFYTFPGGCVSYQFNFAHGGSPLLASQASGAVRFMPRIALVRHVQNTEGLALCGRGAACPG